MQPKPWIIASQKYFLKKDIKIAKTYQREYEFKILDFKI